MMSRVVCWVACWVVCVGMVAGDLEHTCVHGQDLKSGLCGDQLSELLKFLCGNDGYNGFDKRSAVAPELPPFTGDMQDKLDAHKIFLPRKRAMAYLGGNTVGGGTKRDSGKWQAAAHGYQGIVCECCYNHCDVTELMQYCANGGHLTRLGRSSYRAR